jgi:hypothetical protein
MKAHARLSPRTISTSWATDYFNNIGAKRTSAKERGCLSAANCGDLVVTSGYQDGLLSVRRFLDGARGGPPEGRFFAENNRAHRLCECSYLLFRDPDIGAHLGDRAVEGDLRDITLRLHCCDAVLQTQWRGKGQRDASER